MSGFERSCAADPWCFATFRHYSFTLTRLAAVISDSAASPPQRGAPDGSAPRPCAAHPTGFASPFPLSFATPSGVSLHSSPFTLHSFSPPLLFYYPLLYCLAPARDAAFGSISPSPALLVTFLLSRASASHVRQQVPRWRAGRSRNELPPAEGRYSLSMRRGRRSGDDGEEEIGICSTEKNTESQHVISRSRTPPRESQRMAIRWSPVGPLRPRRVADSPQRRMFVVAVQMFASAERAPFPPLSAARRSGGRRRNLARAESRGRREKVKT
jgi:hypothetical protein